MWNIADSLMKMWTGYVDMLQLHNPDVATTEQNGLVDILNERRDAGVVKYIGCSSTTPHLKTYIEWGVFDVFQIPYSALERRHENLITQAAEAGAGLGGADRWQKFEAARLDELLEDGETRTGFLLRFTLSHPHCHTTIVGTMNPAHLQENIGIANKGALPADVYAEAKRRLDAVGESPL